MNTRFAALTIAGVFAGASLLGGCAAVAPVTAANLGTAVRVASLSQQIDPHAGTRAAVQGIDGSAASAILRRYYKSFVAPPPPANVFAIGVSGAAAGGAVGGAAATP